VTPLGGVNEFQRKRWNDDTWTTAWLKRETITRSVTAIFLEHVSVSSGDRVLEIGSGTGDLALEVAARVAPGGSVLGADLSAQLVRAAREKAARAGNDAVRFAVLDAQSATFEDGPFDAALSQFGVMFFDDPVAAFSNIARQLAPGARLSFVCWQDVDANPWCVGPILATYADTVVPPGPDGVPPGPFAFGDPARVRSILASAGFCDIERTRYERTTVVDREALVQQSQLDEVPPAELPEATSAVEQRLSSFRREADTFEIPLAFQVFSARRA
jgi:SAM-dependent methyltransferase